MIAAQERPRPVSVWWLLVGIEVVALNLRGSLVGVGPLLKDIQAATALPATALALLVTLPLLGLGLVSTVASGLARRFGIERLLLWSLAMLTLSTLYRLTPDAWTPWLPPHSSLFLGTFLIGCCIAVGNVVVPSLIRRDLARWTGPLTSMFVATFAASGALAAAIAVPLEQWLGLQGALASWAIPAFVGVLVWLPLSRGRPGMSQAHRQATSAGAVNVWTSRRAWGVTVYMALQSVCFYMLVAWLPTLLRDTGQSPAQAGLVSSFFQASSLAGSFISPFVVARFRDQRVCAAGSSVLTLVGFVLLIVAPSWVGSCMVTGVGCGANLGVAVVLFSSRSANSQDTGALSGMAQSLGYIVAAAGPLIFGALHGVSGNWTLPLSAAAALTAVQIYVGVVAGRPGVMVARPVGVAINR